MSNRESHACIVRGGNAESIFVRELIADMMGDASVHRSKVLRGIHPDVIVVTLEINKNTNKLRAEITVDQIREVVARMAVAPNEAAVSVLVIENAHTMNTSAQNALLKTLEEPPEHVKLILVTDEPGALLATVRSRCVVLNSGEKPDDAPERITELAEEYLTAARGGELALCELSFTLDKSERADIALLLTELPQLAAEWFRAAELTPELTLEIAEKVKTAQEYFERNVATSHITALLCNL